MILFTLLWLACTGDEITEVPVTCNQNITYASVAEPFLRNYCTGCHATKLPSGKRYGAPLNVNLDNYADARTWALRSYVRAVHFETMPPSGGISVSERERFKQWALCGAKGSETQTPVVESAERRTSRTILNLSIEGDDQDMIVLQRWIQDTDLIDEDIDLYREETYFREGLDVWFGGYSEYSLTGEVVSSVVFAPPLPMTEGIWQDELVVMATITINDDTWTEEQVWTGEQSYRALWELDVHERETNPLQTVWWNQQGEEWGWRMSSNSILSSAYGTTIQGLSWEAQQFSGPDGINSESAFPLRKDDGWIDLWIEWGL